MAPLGSVAVFRGILAQAQDQVTISSVLPSMKSQKRWGGPACSTGSDNGTIYKNGFSSMSLVGGQTTYFSPNGGSSSGSQPNNLTGSSFTYFNTTAGGDW